jgi:hypothetical protein
MCKMALLSEQDHKLVIKALGWYMNHLDSTEDAEEVAACHALLNWIKIQEQKL